MYVAGRELLRRLSAARMRETNPKCKVVTDIGGGSTAPVVDVEFGEWYSRCMVAMWREELCVAMCNVTPITVCVCCAVDGTSLQFEASGMKALEMVAAINKKARTTT